MDDYQELPARQNQSPEETMPISELHEMARGYAQDGIKIFPCKPSTKEPATRHGFKDASCDIEQIDKWWTENPDYNIALCPEDNGWGTVDVEADGLRDWEMLRLKRPPFETFTNRTPSGGLHLYFEGSLPSKVRVQGLNIDTRGRGGYVLVPPSVVNGNPYEVALETDVAPLPDWIKELFTAKVCEPSKAKGAPVRQEQLEARLGYMDPDSDYGTWRNTVAAIHATNLVDDESSSKRHELAHRWSRGDLWYDGPARRALMVRLRRRTRPIGSTR